MDTKVLEQMLTAMTRAGASSLHLIPGQTPCVRVQRKFVHTEHEVVEKTSIDELTRDLLFDDHRARLQRDGQVDVLYVSRTGRRFRTTVLRQEQGLALLLRPVPEAPPQLQELQLPPQVASFVQFRSGLVLITGFFGSGKSTTLAALVDRFNHETARHVVTIEDPIEYLHPQGQALLHQREIGPHVRDYETGIRQSMRLGAEVIVLSELADGQTMNAALDAVESGCLVLAGFDATSVVGACMELPMLVPMEDRPRMRVRLAAAMRAITTQTLLPCAHQQGRVPMVEVLINNSAVRTAIRQGSYKELPVIMNRCRGLGMQTSDVALRGLLAQHLITPEEAMQHAQNRDQVLARTPVQRIL
jgi:twitching motility protein PilT